MTAGQLTLSEAYPERFLLGLGVSHARLVEGIRGHRTSVPLQPCAAISMGWTRRSRSTGPQSHSAAAACARRPWAEDARLGR